MPSAPTTGPASQPPPKPAAATAPARAVQRILRRLLRHLRSRDADLAALRRSCRAAIVGPGAFAVAIVLAGDTTAAVFAAFGALATLLFVDFGGSTRQRLAAQAALVVAGALLVCLGTVVSRVLWQATSAMVVVAFAVLFSGVVSSALAGASTALLAGFIVAVSLPGTVDTVPERLAGWLMSGAASLIAVGVLWPAPAREPLRLATAHACALLARRLRAEAACPPGSGTPDDLAARDRLVDEARQAVTALHTSFFAAPYRPTGLTTAARMLVRLVDQVAWLEAILDRSGRHGSGPLDAVVCEVRLAAADLLEQGAGRLESASGAPGALDPALRRLSTARTAMENAVVSALPARRAEGRDAPDGPDGPGGPDASDADVLDGADRPEEPGGADAAGRFDVSRFVGSLEPGFRAEEMSTAVFALTTTIELTVAAYRRTWWQALLGRRPQGVPSPLASVQERAGAHVEPHSVWLHNSVRGAAALGLAVLVAGVSGVQQSFWAVFGTLAVLRSNALLTGQSVVRGLAGTVVGIVIGGGLIVAVGPDTTVLWLLLPPAVVFTGLAPAAISFAAGQAGFTCTLLILFNLIEPAGWQIGIVRIQDVALGCAVSVVIGALFWPRGAAPALGRALGAALSAASRYLRGAVDHGLTSRDARTATAREPSADQRRAAAAARRLDDAFRSYLAEHGTKHIPLADVTALITAVAVLRLTGDAVTDLWTRDDAPIGMRGGARAELHRAGALLDDWYQRTARALAGGGPTPGPPARDRFTDGRLTGAVRRDLAGAGRPTATTVKVLWTADHIDVARRLQAAIATPARAVAGRGPEARVRTWPRGGRSR